MEGRAVYCGALQGRHPAPESARGLAGEIGHLHHVYFDDREWQTHYLAVQTGGWLRGRLLLIAPGAVEVRADEKRFLFERKREQIEAGAPSSPPQRNVYLCSSDEVAGCEVLARDGYLGEVVDLMLDDESW